MPKKPDTRTNANGYDEFFDESLQQWVLTHRRAAENKLGRQLRPDEHVHHVNRNRQDNRWENLIVLKDNIHRRIHNVDPDACYKCGRSSHAVADCYATTDFEGNLLG